MDIMVENFLSLRREYKFLDLRNWMIFKYDNFKEIYVRCILIKFFKIKMLIDILRVERFWRGMKGLVIVFVFSYIREIGRSVIVLIKEMLFLK